MSIVPTPCWATASPSWLGAGDSLPRRLDLSWISASTSSVCTGCGAGCGPENADSIRVLKKLGMVQEAHMRQECNIRGEWRDTLLLAVLADEWARAAAEDST